MRKIVLFLALACFGLGLNAQSSMDVINLMEGEIDLYNEIARSSAIAETVFASLSLYPAIVYPISTWADIDQKTKLQLEQSYQAISAIALTGFLTTFILKMVYENKAIKKTEQIYEYKKIITKEDF